MAFPGARRCGPARLDPGEPARARLPALVRGRRLDLPAAAEAAAGPRGLPADRLAARRARRLDRVRRGHGADPVAPVRDRPRLLAPGERARDACDRPVARDRPRGLADPAAAAVRSACARVPERLGRGLHRRLCAGRGWAAARSDRLRCGGLRPARHAAGAPRPAAAAALAPSGRTRVRGDAGVPALLVWQLFPAATLPPPTGLRITFLDVGQGDAVLLQVPEGQSWSIRGRRRRRWRSSSATWVSAGWPRSC